MQIEVDLALGTVSAVEESRIRRRLPPDFFIEDRTSQGWGFSVGTHRKLPEEVDTAISEFLAELAGLNRMIKKKNGLLRVAVFHDTYTCTVRLTSLERLTSLNLTIEISTYPTQKES